MEKILECKSKVIENVLLADSFLKRFLGYMFRKTPHYNAIIIKPCNSIHSFFMKFSIDVIFLNQEMKVVHKVEGLKPRKIIRPVKSAVMVIEGREGSLQGIEIGDRVYF